MKRNEKKYIKSIISRAKRQVANLPIAKAYNKTYNRLVKIELQYNYK